MQPLYCSRKFFVIENRTLRIALSESNTPPFGGAWGGKSFMQPFIVLFRANPVRPYTKKPLSESVGCSAGCSFFPITAIPNLFFTHSGSTS